MAKKLTKITKAHYVKLVYRSLLLIIGIAFYIFQKVTTNSDVNFNNFGFTPEKFGFDLTNRRARCIIDMRGTTDGFH